MSLSLFIHALGAPVVRKHAASSLIIIIVTSTVQMCPPHPQVLPSATHLHFIFSYRHCHCHHPAPAPAPPLLQLLQMSSMTRSSITSSTSSSNGNGNGNLIMNVVFQSKLRGSLSRCSTDSLHLRYRTPSLSYATGRFHTFAPLTILSCCPTTNLKSSSSTCMIQAFFML